MSAAVKREYRSALRTARADDTRRSIVDAAGHLFVQHGYGATTLDAVAEAAGVSRKTVFTAVGGKLDLLKTALDWAVGGDDRPVTVVDRPGLRHALELDDPVAFLHACGEVIGQINERAAALVRVLEAAAGTDSGARALAEDGHRLRLHDAATIVDRLRALKALTARLDPDEAVDVVWLALDPGLFDRLVRVRGWSPDRFATWLGDRMVSALIDG